MNREKALTPAEVVAAVHGWNTRKAIFSQRQIGIAVETLRTKGWLEAAA